MKTKSAFISAIVFVLHYAVKDLTVKLYDFMSSEYGYIKILSTVAGIIFIYDIITTISR